ncbi:CopD family protein [Pseudomonas asuensis]|uniref:Membrane protein n=1 Tax=Pseudomonas asuensis TaxID=1825787 RepID=A0ABQ2GPW0_9PSED|nr:CopD family protein [Pseudomonas asuensis]GGM07344.1 membrane protein [Pseudomonas asuensis]
MTPSTWLYTIHVLAAVLWVGSLFFAWVILHPVVAATLDTPTRIRFWNALFPRFFRWVWGAVITLPVTGIGILHLNFNGFETAPRYIQIMMGLYLAMVALFLKIHAIQLPQLRRSVSGQDWLAAAQVLKQIRTLAGFNLLLGISVVIVASARLNAFG